MEETESPTPSETNDEPVLPEDENSIEGEEEDEQNFQLECNVEKVPAKKYTDIPMVDRMTYPRGTKMDAMLARIPKPHGLVPLRFMPIWPEMSTDGKIPVLPAPEGLFELCRGELGKGLLKPAPNYTVEDPLNKEKVITSPYTALHDPHAVAYFRQPYTRKQMIRKEFVYPDGTVRCSIKEFNEYRRYLSKRIYLPNVTSTHAEREKIETLQKDQVKRIKRDMKRRDKEDDSVKSEGIARRAKLLRIAREEEVKARFLQARAEADYRCDAHMKRVGEERDNRMLRGIAKEGQIRIKVERIKEEAELRRKAIIQGIIDKEARAKEYIKSERERKKAEKTEALIDWLSVRCEAQQRQIECAAETQKMIRATLKKRAMRRQMKIDADLANMPARLAARQAEEERLWDLVRKYFFRWLENVRKRKARKPDEFHRSFWEVQGEMDGTVKQLRKESGYEKFDDFIMNIVKLKRDIKAELESEEQAEAAAALGIISRTQEQEEAEEEDAEEGGGATEPTSSTPAEESGSPKEKPEPPKEEPEPPKEEPEPPKEEPEPPKEEPEPSVAESSPPEEPPAIISEPDESSPVVATEEEEE